jgi:NADH/NAD ratio-sensing transcriptional regulator Rex
MVDANYVEEYHVTKAPLATWSALVVHFRILHLVLQDTLLHEQRISSSDIQTAIRVNSPSQIRVDQQSNIKT